MSVRTGASDGVHALVDRLTDFVRHVPPPASLLIGAHGVGFVERV